MPCTVCKKAVEEDNLEDDGPLVVVVTCKDMKVNNAICIDLDFARQR